MNTHEKTPGSRLIEAAKEAVETAKGKPTGAVWHFMSPQAVAAYGPWIRKEDHDAIVQSQAARIAALEAGLEPFAKAWDRAMSFDKLATLAEFGAVACHHVSAVDFRAARRVREGGNVDG